MQNFETFIIKLLFNISFILGIIIKYYVQLFKSFLTDFLGRLFFY